LGVWLGVKKQKNPTKIFMFKKQCVSLQPKFE